MTETKNTNPDELNDDQLDDAHCQGGQTGMPAEKQLQLPPEAGDQSLQSDGQSSRKCDQSSQSKDNGKDQQPEGSWWKETLHTFALAFVIFLFVKGTVAEARYIPSSSMEPTLNIEDRILVEKITNRILGRDIQRGDVIVFFPPVIETGVADNSLLQAIGGLPFLPEGPPVFVKRAVGVPGDSIVVKSGVGVFINGNLLDETAYVKEPPRYDLSTMGDIGGYATTREFIHPYGDSMEPIVVPEGHLFVMGDNRNHSADSHVWGFLDKKRVIGRSCLIFWQSKWLHSLMGLLGLS